MGFGNESPARLAHSRMFRSRFGASHVRLVLVFSLYLFSSVEKHRRTRVSLHRCVYV